MILASRRCTRCNTKTTVLKDNSHPLCSLCVPKFCELSYLPNCDNRMACNNLSECITRDGHVLCYAHYKKLQQHCRSCGHPAAYGDSLSYDNWYYCSLHKPSPQEQSKVVHRCFESVLDRDCIQTICEFL
jgi:hypothetical protein